MKVFLIRLSKHFKHKVMESYTCAKKENIGGENLRFTGNQSSGKVEGIEEALQADGKKRDLVRKASHVGK